MGQRKARQCDRDDHCDPRSAKDGILGISGLPNDTIHRDRPFIAER